MLKLNYKFVESDNELKGAFQVRKGVFVEEQGISEDLELDGRDSEALHMVVQYGERIIGTARVLFPSPGVAKIERMAILKTFRRKGVGSKIISFLNGELKAKNVNKVIPDSPYIPFNSMTTKYLRNAQLFYFNIREYQSILPRLRILW